MFNRPLIVPGAMAAAMLMIALGSHAYGYYTLLRWVVCAAAVLFVISYYARRAMWAVWVFGFIALLFNPIAPIRLARSTWAIVDAVTAIVFVVGALSLKARDDSQTQSVNQS
jgi:hypothetical protein